MPNYLYYNNITSVVDDFQDRHCPNSIDLLRVHARLIEVHQLPHSLYSRVIIGVQDLLQTNKILFSKLVKCTSRTRLYAGWVGGWVVVCVCVGVWGGGGVKEGSTRTVGL